MSRSSELGLLLDELNALLRHARALLEPGLIGAALNDKALADVDSAIVQIGPMFRQLRLLSLDLPASEWESLVTDCRRECPAALAQFIDWLGLPSSEG